MATDMDLYQKIHKLEITTRNGKIHQKYSTKSQTTNIINNNTNYTSV
jgi:hypothetical protein